jgi:hypothetical protein
MFLSVAHSVKRLHTPYVNILGNTLVLLQSVIVPAVCQSSAILA